MIGPWIAVKAAARRAPAWLRWRRHLSGAISPLLEVRPLKPSGANSPAPAASDKVFGDTWRCTFWRPFACQWPARQSDRHIIRSGDQLPQQASWCTAGTGTLWLDTRRYRTLHQPEGDAGVAYCSEHKSAAQDGYRIALACYIVTARRTDVKLVPSIAVTAVQTRSSDPRFRRIKWLDAL
jgi:hypothetical protein